MRSLALEPDVVDDVTVELSRHKTPIELTVLTSRMFSNARDMLRGYLREQHPDWSDLQLYAELFRRIHGTGPVAAARGRDPLS
jgi:hypothetical protein